MVIFSSQLLKVIMKKIVILLTTLTSFIFTVAQNVGIGTTSPGFPLNFSNITGDKISLYGNSGNHYGFGIQSALLQIHTDLAASNIAFGHGASNNFTERMHIINNVGYDGMSLNGRLILKNESTDLVGGAAGVWLYKADNTALLGFMGVQNNQNIVFFGGPGVFSVPIPGLNNQLVTLDQSSTIVINSSLIVNSSSFGTSRYYLKILIFNSLNQLLENANGHGEVPNGTYSSASALLSVNQQQGFYSIEAYLERVNDTDGDCSSNITARAIIQVFPN